jgi:hypothetical protein
MTSTTEIPDGTFDTSETTGPERAWLRALAAGRACPADVAELLIGIANGRHVTGHDVHAATRDRERVENFYGRLRAAGLDIPGGDGLPVTSRPEDCPRVTIGLARVRDQLRQTARAYMAAMDNAAVTVAEARKLYVSALG